LELYLHLRGAALFALSSFLLFAAPAPPLICPAGGPIGSVDLRVMSVRNTGEALPLRTINRLDEGDTLLYRPLLHSGEERKGEVTLVLVPANQAAVGEKLRILEPKPAGKPQQWKCPWRVAVVGYVYGPSGLNIKKVRNFLTRDDELIAQLAEYAEKTAQTEALIAALSSPNSSAAVHSALQGFASQYGVSVQIDRTASPEQQAMTMFRTLNPAIASYDPIGQQAGRPAGQTASLATSVATLFFGSPVGLAAGGTAMLLELRSLAFPKTEFRSSFSQSVPNDGLGLCGRRDATAAHTKIAYLWASRVPNASPPQLSIAKANSLPTGVKSPLPVTAADTEWKVVERARNWMLEQPGSKPIPIKVGKLEGKMLELDLGAAVKPGSYTLVASWDWDSFRVKGSLDVRELNSFIATKLVPASQDLLVAKTGKVPVTLAGGDFEFVTKVEIEKTGDRFSSPQVVPFVLPAGVRQGPQDHIDVQVNTIDLDPGNYRLLLTQVDGKPHPVAVKILPAPPTIGNLPVVLNQGASALGVRLKGERLDLLTRLEIANGTAELGPADSDASERSLTIHVPAHIAAGTSLAMKAYIRDRSQPLTFSDAVRIVGQRPKITEATVSQPPDQDVQLDAGELAGGAYLSVMMRVDHLQSNSAMSLSCDQPGGTVTKLRLGERSGALSFQQLAPGQVFLSFDSSPWPSGCKLEARIENGGEGTSEPWPLGRVLRVPRIERFDLAAPDVATGEVTATVTGQNLETIEKAGWTADQPAAVSGLPLPVSGAAPKQTLEIHLKAPDDTAQLYIWLRGESKPRLARVKPVMPVNVGGGN
jgi:hypothetical protein